MPAIAWLEYCWYGVKHKTINHFDGDSVVVCVRLQNVAIWARKGFYRVTTGVIRGLAFAASLAEPFFVALDYDKQMDLLL